MAKLEERIQNFSPFIAESSTILATVERQGLTICACGIAGDDVSPSGEVSSAFEGLLATGDFSVPEDLSERCSY